MSRTSSLAALAALLLGAALLPSGASGATRATTLGPPPTKPCPHSPGMSERRGNCLFQYEYSPYGPPGSLNFKLTPHLVRVGERITGIVTDKRGQTRSGQWGWLVPGSWIPQPGCTGGTKVPGFGESIPMDKLGNGRCTWKVTERLPQGTVYGFDNKERRWHGWLTAGVGDGVMGSAPDNDYFFIIDKDESVIEGHVTSTAGLGVRGVRVTIGGGGGQVYAVTDGNGYFNAIVSEGTFTVKPSKGSQRFDPPLRRVRATRAATRADFVTGGKVVIQGHVRDHRGDPLGGVKVDALSTTGGKRQSDLTDAKGLYRIEAPAGAYVVVPQRSGRTDRERYAPVSRRVQGDATTVTADFTLAAADELTVRTDSTVPVQGIYSTLVAASGGVFEYGSATLRNGRDDPVAGERVKFDPAYWDVAPPGSPDPNVLVCDDVWRRVYPGATFERFTGPDGQIDFSVWFGSDRGNWWLKGREARDTALTGVLRVGQVGGVLGPDNEAIIGALGNPFAGGGPLLTGPSLDATQETILDWLLKERESSAKGAQFPMGDFGPFRSADGRSGGIVFYPSGNPGPLRAHLLTGAPLPGGYETRVIAIRPFFIVGGTTWVAQLSSGPAGLMSLQQWENVEFRTKAVAGYATPRTGERLAWFGGPYPPSSANTDARRAFDRCAPGAAPANTVFSVHSPVRLLIRDAKGRSLGYDAKGKLVGTLAGWVSRGGTTAPGTTTYVVPRGTYTVRLTGTGRGRATIVASTPGPGGDQVAVFTLASRRGATGTLKVAPRGAAGALTFGGRRVRAGAGVGLRLAGVPRRVTAGRRVALTLRVSDQFGRRVGGALASVRGSRVNARGLSDARGRVRLTFVAPRSGRLRLAVSAPGHVAATRTVPVRQAR